MVVTGTFIDNFSRKALVNFLKQKFDTRDTFKIFKIFVERQNGCQINILRTDRGQKCLICDYFLKKNEI